MKRFALLLALSACVAFAQPAKKDAKKTEPHTSTQQEPKEVADPVCGMTMAPKDAAGKYTYKGKTYYFCSKEEQQEFQKQPEKYIKK